MQGFFNILKLNWLYSQSKGENSYDDLKAAKETFGIVKHQN